MNQLVHILKSYSLLPTIIFVSVLILLGLIFEKLIIDQYVKDQRIEVTDQLSEIKSDIEKVVNLNLNLIEGLTAYISTNPNITQEEFAKLGEEVLRKNPALRNIAAAPDLVISLMHPIKGNEKAIGLDYRKNEKQRKAALEAIENRATIIAGPLTLIQGGVAFISRTPVYIANNKKEERLWGLISTVLDAEKFYELTGLNQNKSRLNIGLRGKDSTGKNGAVFYGDPLLFEQDVVTSNINLPHGNWYMVAAPNVGWSKAYPNQAIFRLVFLIILGVVSYLLVVNRINTVRRQHAEIVAQQATLQKEMAIESSQMKSHFLANMSHELRTPMHAILSFSNLGLKRVNDEKIRNYLEKIQSSSVRLTKLLDELLDLSKLEAGKSAPKIQENDLTSTVLDAIDEVSSLANDKDIAIDISTDKPQIGLFDKSLMIRVLINIISNAIKFSPTGSKIIITIDTKKDREKKALYCSILDEGVGIPPDEIKDVFNSFVQSSKTKLDGRGTGLGLPIAKEIIELHGGKIWVVSPPAGKDVGTELIFKLPISAFQKQ